MKDGSVSQRDGVTEKKPLLKKDKLVEKGLNKEKSKAAADFKRRYFEFYDDIKISDRQDW